MPGKYEELLLERATAKEMEIVRDLSRTYPSHVYYQQRQGPGQRSLYNVLKAYACFDKQARLPSIQCLSVIPLNKISLSRAGCPASPFLPLPFKHHLPPFQHMSQHYEQLWCVCKPPAFALLIDLPFIDLPNCYSAEKHLFLVPTALFTEK